MYIPWILASTLLFTMRDPFDRGDCRVILSAPCILQHGNHCPPAHHQSHPAATSWPHRVQSSRFLIFCFLLSLRIRTQMRRRVGVGTVAGHRNKQISMGSLGFSSLDSGCTEQRCHVQDCRIYCRIVSKSGHSPVMDSWWSNPRESQACQARMSIFVPYSRPSGHRSMYKWCEATVPQCSKASSTR